MYGVGVRPLDAEIGIEWMDAVLAARCVRLGAEIPDSRRISERTERVPQALGYINGTTRIAIEFHGFPGTESG